MRNYFWYWDFLNKNLGIHFPFINTRILLLLEMPYKKRTINLRPLEMQRHQSYFLKKREPQIPRKKCYF